jgi:hypothetical protein
MVHKVYKPAQYLTSSDYPDTDQREEGSDCVSAHDVGSLKLLSINLEACWNTRYDTKLSTTLENGANYSKANANRANDFSPRPRGYNWELHPG